MEDDTTSSASRQHYIDTGTYLTQGSGKTALLIDRSMDRMINKYDGAWMLTDFGNKMHKAMIFGGEPVSICQGRLPLSRRRYDELEELVAGGQPTDYPECQRCVKVMNR